jgi:hypothetical protein
LSSNAKPSPQHVATPLFIGIVVSVFVLMVAPSAFAQASATPESDKAWTQSPDTPEAQSRFAEGVDLARASNFEGAALAFRDSFEQSPSRSALFAWAQSERLSGHCGKAMPLYERFLKNSPPPEQQQAASIAIRRCAETPNKPVLVATAAPPSPLPAVPQPSIQDVQAEPVDKQRPLWPLAATGASLVVAGAVGLVVSQFEINAAEQASSYQNYRESRDRSRIEQIIGWSAAGLGMATLGATAWIAWPSLSKREEISNSLAMVQPTIGPGSLIATIKGTF